MKTTVNVTGMTCEHCVASVTEELEELPEVTEVSVDLKEDAASPVTITHTGELSPEQIEQAISAAGYATED